MSSEGVSGDASYSLPTALPPVSSSSARRTVLTVETRLGAEARLLTGLEEGGCGGGGISGASNALFPAQLKEQEERKQRKEEEGGRGGRRTSRYLHLYRQSSRTQRAGVFLQ